MFEFDEHFAELEAIDFEETTSEPQNPNSLLSWSYVGNGVWKLNFDVDKSQVSPEWQSKTVDIA